MRVFIDLIEGTVSTEFPVKAGDCRQTVKALAGERVEVRWLSGGVGYTMPANTSLKFVVRDQKGGTLLAELTSFTVPEDVTTGYYTGRISFNTDTVAELLTANPTKNTFVAVGEMLWKLSGASDWECSDDITFTLLRKVSAGDSEGDPLVMASGFQWLQDRLVAGANVTLTVDEEAETITVAATGGGSSAWGDITGKPSTFPPSTHASTHVDGTDDIQSATASQKGLATAAQITKLDGIESGADVTDAGNVGAAIDAAAAITTIADADKLAITQSGTLKSIAYSAFKTLLNALYQPVKTILTTLGNLSNSAGVLLNDGSGGLSWLQAVVGGNGNADSDKIVRFNSGGSISSCGLNVYPITATGAEQAAYSIDRLTFQDAAGHYVQIIAPSLTSNRTAGFVLDDTLGTGVATALAIAIGSAGAPVVNGGSLGTPSSATLTNASGTAANLTAGQATAALGLKSATTTIAINAATAPSSGQVLTATGASAATWQNPSGGGSTNLWIGASDMIPRVTTGCSINSEETPTYKVNDDVLEFDPATNQYTDFCRVMPNNWNAGTITFKPYWKAVSGSGDVVWGLQARALADGDVIDQAYGTAQTSTDTLVTAATQRIGPASSAITIAGSPANGQLIKFRVYRDSVAGGDTLAVAAQLIGIEIIF